MKTRIYIAILVMGFSGLVAQILLLREMLIVFSGNELSIGLILANWLILEALGCFFLGRIAEKSPHQLETFSLMTVLFFSFVLVAIFLTRTLKNTLGVSIGESIGLVPMFFSSLLILLPVSLLHGALFPLSCRLYAAWCGQESSAPGKVYVYETMGTIIGAIVCTYLFIPYLHSFQAASWLALLNVLACLALFFPLRRVSRYYQIMAAFLILQFFVAGSLVFAGLADRLHQASISAQWKHQQIVHYQNSRFGNISVVANEGQYIFFMDGVPALITPVPDIPFVEEFVHLPLLAHPNPSHLLFLSGGAGGMIHEALKHPTVEAIEYAELDPLLLELLQKFPTELTDAELNDPRVTVQHIDGRLLLQATSKTYDIIFLGTFEPSNLQANRFFTREFFSLARSRLNPDGILVLGLPGSFTFLSDELRNLNSSLFSTLHSVFPYIRVIPGDGSNFFLASDSQAVITLNTEKVVERLHERKMTTDVILPWHIENKLHQGWQDWFLLFLEDGSQRINHDFKPLGLFYSISHWNAVFAPAFGSLFSQFEKIRLEAVALGCVLMLGLYALVRIRWTVSTRVGIPFAIVTTGFAGMIFDLMIIFAFQAIFGYVFAWIGLLVAAFMAGAAGGAMLATWAMTRRGNCFSLFVRVELAILFFSLALPALFFSLHAHLDNPSFFIFFRMFFLLVSCLCGLLIGAQFPLANKIYLNENENMSRTAAYLYASDLVGGWLGGIAGAVVLLPVLGLTGTCLTVAMLKLTSFLVIITLPNQRS
ncbi:fused MFS/spermidine synthase [Desulfobulbus alkaliphilus]|uniref:fused MFS/spermidine synthase n=1 Tax=Desulfobulbus alkaliphilus TaxID=869814 RepID=UPI00196484A5|nr:fused MFS/spermidine synthase [Desulfobulbus alkaliphilus]MBM9535827.1 fused MFS/spermidine synthase [Desulfobulbus alkaliphilus]